MIKISKYDPEVDAIYIKINDDKVLESEEIADGIIVDYNDHNDIVGFELLGISNITIQSVKILKSVLSPNAIAMLQEFNIFSKIFCQIS